MKLYVQFYDYSGLFHSLERQFSKFCCILPVPGSIIGLVLLFLALEFKLIRLRHIDVVGNFFY